jgi:dynein heavy chain
MACQINPVYLLAHNLPALMEIQMDLIDKRVSFSPEVGQDELDSEGSTNIESGIKDIVTGWINGMLGLSSAFKRLDSGEGTYLREILESPEVQGQRSRVIKYLNNMEVKANKLRSQFRKFEYLWLTNLNDLFAEFLTGVVQREYIPFSQPGEEVTTNTNDTTQGGNVGPGVGGIFIKN